MLLNKLEVLKLTDTVLKGTLSRDLFIYLFSTSGFIHQSIPPRALTHGLKPFRNGFSGVIDTSETVSAVSLTPLKLE
jgi:hypothetical protein